MKKSRYRVVYVNGEIGELQQFYSGGCYLIADWYTKHHPGYTDLGGPSLAFYSVNEQEYGHLDKSSYGHLRAVKCFDTLDDFQIWFTEKYFADIL